MEFTEELHRFRARVGARRVPALIIPGSGQAQTAALLIGALEPQRVAFLLTPDSAQMPTQVAQLLGLWHEGWRPEELRWACHAEDHTRTLQIYRSLRTIIRAWEDLPHREIAVDVTGGTKPMSVGLAKAAYMLAIEALYIESDFTPPDSGGRRQLIPGSQRLAPPPDPYVVFGHLEAAEAARLFAAHDYAGAEGIFAVLARRLQHALAEESGLAAEDPTLAAEVELLAANYAASARLATAYAHWDSFDLPTAQEALRAYLLAAPPTGDRARLLQAQRDDLARLATVTSRAGGKGRDALATLADPDAVLPLLGALYANARRREAQGRYDTAALLCYRCLELCSQHRLAGWDVLTERPELRELLRRRPRLEEAYRNVEEQVGFEPRGLPRPGRNGRLSPIALFGGYMLLAALGDPLVEGFDIEQIRARAELRNKSILAHGYRLITHAEYAQFAALVEELLDRLFAVLGRERAAWTARSTFLPLE